MYVLPHVRSHFGYLCANARPRAHLKQYSFLLARSVVESRVIAYEHQRWLALFQARVDRASFLFFLVSSVLFLAHPLLVLALLSSTLQKIYRSWFVDPRYLLHRLSKARRCERLFPVLVV